MPTIAGLIDLVAAGGSTGATIEPVKNTGWRLRISVNNLLIVLKGQFPADAVLLQTTGQSLIGDVYPLDVKFTPPDIHNEVRKIKGKGNLTSNYSGWTEWGDVSVEYYNYLGVDTYKFFYRWASLPGAMNLKRNNDIIQSDVLSASAMIVPDTWAGAGATIGYKVNATVDQYAVQNSAGALASENPEVSYNHWVLQGLWPSSVSTTGFDNSGDGDPILTSVKFTVDSCLPCTPNNMPTF